MRPLPELTPFRGRSGRRTGDHSAVPLADRGRERLAEVGADLADLAVAEVSGAPAPVEGLAVDELCDEQGAAVLLAHLVEGDDPGMVEARRGLGLAQHAVAAGRPAGIDRLDRDRALEATVPCLVDRAETAAADAALDQKSIQDE